MADISKYQSLDGTTYNLKDPVARSCIAFGQVDSTSTATAFTATVEGVTEYFDGLTIVLKNGVVTSAKGFTLNVNGLGAKNSYNNMAAATQDTTLFNINYTMMFIYDSTRVSGGGWICYRGYDANTNTVGYQLRTNSSTRQVSDQTGRYRLLFTSADNTKFVPANTTNSTNATSSRAVNQRPIDPFGDIVYYSSTTILSSGTNLSATAQWQQYPVTLGYSFNRTGATLALPYPAPLFIKCAPQADGSAIMDADTPYVTALPSTKDGKIYIYLGQTYSATAVELRMNHPVYYYDGSGIRIWSGKVIPTKTSDLTNDSGFLTSAVTTFNGQSGAVTYTAPVTSVNGQTGAVTVNTPLVLRGSMSVTLSPTHGTGTFTLSSGNPNDIPNYDTVYIVSSSNLSTDDIVLQKNRYSSYYYAYFTTTFRTTLGTVYVEIEGTPDDEYDWDYATWNVRYWVLQDKLTFDTTPTQDSTNPVTSGGIRTAINNINVGVTSVNGNTGAVTVSEMPSATNEVDGTALVAVDGEWTKQTGYGYREQGEIEDINTSIGTEAGEAALLFMDEFFTEGTEYSVTYDNTEYTLTAFAATIPAYDNASIVGIGNGQLVGLSVGDPNCPFICGTLEQTMNVIITSTGGTHAITITHVGTITHKCDRALIDTIVRDLNGVTQIDGRTDAYVVGQSGSIALTPYGVSAGQNSVSMGGGIALGDNSVAEGSWSKTGDMALNAHAEGSSEADGYYAHAEGENTFARAQGSHSEGYNTIAQSSASYAHVEGSGTVALGAASHAEGYATTANADYSHAEGEYTIAAQRNQHVFGRYNIQDRTGSYVEIVGNGSNGSQSNARTLDWSGNETLAGKLTVGAAPTNNMDVATKQYVDSNTLPASTTYVSSFNGSTGAITYTAPVTSVNGATGATVSAFYVTFTDNSGTYSADKTFDATLDAFNAGYAVYAISGSMVLPLVNYTSTILTFARQTSASVTQYTWLKGTGAITRTQKSYLTTAVTSFNGNTGAVTFTESDPTVPAWAKESTKPTYTASEVGALPSDTTYVSSFNGSSGAITYTAPVTSVNGNTGAVTLSIPTKTTARADSNVLYNGQSVDTTIDNVGISTSNNLLNTSGHYVALRANSGNPFLGLKEGSNLWYAQAASNYFYFGPTSTKALRLDQSGNGVFQTGSVTATSIIKSGGTSSQFLKADGSVDSSTYLTASTGVTSVNGSHGAVTGLQTTGNLVTSVSSSSTDTQYPSAKLFYDTVGNIESLLASI